MRGGGGDKGGGMIFDADLADLAALLRSLSSFVSDMAPRKPAPTWIADEQGDEISRHAGSRSV